MLIRDERRIVFDVDALRNILKLSQSAARAVGLPRTNSSDIILNPSAKSATFKFVGAEITLGFEKLGALLLSYCIRAGIRIPRSGERTVLVECATITLLIQKDYKITPILSPLFRIRRVRAR